jgi:GNAT superfamily N-acetyltransferase
MYTKTVNGEATTREVEFKNIGRVSFYTKGERTDISISIEEEHQKKGLSKLILKELMEVAREEGFRHPFIYIDTDASSGFWDHVGFTTNPYYEDKSKPDLYGYEKRISWEALWAFCLSK